MEFFNSSINVIDVAFKGRFFNGNFLLVSVDEAVVDSALFESAKIGEYKSHIINIIQLTWTIACLFTIVDVNHSRIVITAFRLSSMFGTIEIHCHTFEIID